MRRMYAEEELEKIIRANKKLYVHKFTFVADNLTSEGALQITFNFLMTTNTKITGDTFSNAIYNAISFYAKGSDDNLGAIFSFIDFDGEYANFVYVSDADGSVQYTSSELSNVSITGYTITPF